MSHDIDSKMVALMVQVVKFIAEQLEANGSQPTTRFVLIVDTADASHIFHHGLSVPERIDVVMPALQGLIRDIADEHGVAQGPLQ